MDRFKIKALKPESRNQNVIKNCYGFTLIELLFAIATVAILIGLLLPVIQTKREEYAANKATQNLTALIGASNEYFSRMGSYPTRLQDLAQFCAANQGLCSLDAQLLSGRAGGYVFTPYLEEGTTYNIVAEPEFPGITGSITHTYDSDLGLIASTPTPGSDEARQRAFNNILASGAKTVVDLLALDSSGAATAQVRANTYTGPTTVNASTLTSVFVTLGGGDDKVSVNEFSTFLTSDPAGPTHVPLKAFNDAVRRELRLDTLEGQAGQDIAVSMAELDTTEPLLFSYDGLGNLTIALADITDGTSNTMLAKLVAAEAAEANGNLNRKAKSLKQYRKLVKGQIGTSLTSTNANILITLSTTL